MFYSNFNAAIANYWDWKFIKKGKHNSQQSKIQDSTKFSWTLGKIIVTNFRRAKKSEKRTKLELAHIYRKFLLQKSICWKVISMLKVVLRKKVIRAREKWFYAWKVFFSPRIKLLFLAQSYFLADFQLATIRLGFSFRNDWRFVKCKCEEEWRKNWAKTVRAGVSNIYIPRDYFPLFSMLCMVNWTIHWAPVLDSQNTKLMQNYGCGKERKKATNIVSENELSFQWNKTEYLTPVAVYLSRRIATLFII